MNLTTAPLDIDWRAGKLRIIRIAVPLCTTLAAVLLLGAEAAALDPDLDVLFIERSPMYNSLHGHIVYPSGYPEISPAEYATTKRQPDPGEAVTFTANVMNTGVSYNSPIPYRWKVDGVIVANGSFPELAAGATIQTTLNWAWQAGDHILEFAVDPANAILELNEANNTVTEYTNALSLYFQIEQAAFNYFKTLTNQNGSTGFHDWVRIQLKELGARFERAAVNGVFERLRVGKVQIFNDNTLPCGGMHANQSENYDGVWGWQLQGVSSCAEGTYSQAFLSSIAGSVEEALLHELAHQQGLIDSYNMDVAANNVSVLDSSGNPVSGTAYLPKMAWCEPNPDCPVYYNKAKPSLLSDSSGELHLFDAVGLYSNLGKRRGYYGDYLYDLPQTVKLKIVDVSSQPFPGANLYFYQRQTNGTIPNTVVFQGTTDNQGVYTLPNRAAVSTLTYTNHQLSPNPFGQVSVVGGNGTLLFRADYGGQSKYFWLDITELVVAYHQVSQTEATFTRTFPGVAPPSITSLNPTSGSDGGLVIISGSGFGATQGSSNVKFFNNQTATIVSWSGTQIQCKVPSGAATGGVTVTTAGGTSAGVTFTAGYPQSPHNYPDNSNSTSTYTLSGSPGAIDVTFSTQTQVELNYDYIYVMDGSGINIAGSPFTGTTLAGQTKQVPGATVKIGLTSDGNINSWGFKVTNIASAPPSITSLNPTSGSDGGLVIISGSGFGATQGSSNVKFFNNQTATIVSWSETQIQCKVPSGAATGSVTVTTAGGTSAGVTFTVGYPQSPHNYPDNSNSTSTYMLAGGPGAIDVTFSTQTQVELNYDYIYVMDGSGVNIAGSPFTGTTLAGQTKQVPGATVKIGLTSDGNINFWGFKAINIASAPIGQIDLDVTYISRLPRYDYDAAKGWPAPGDIVTFTAHVINKGSSSSGDFSFRWSIDGSTVQSGVHTSLSPGIEAQEQLSWTWQSGNHAVKFEADPGNVIAETFEANNFIEDRTNALAAGFWVEQSLYNWFNLHQNELGLGSNSWEDWAQRQIAIWNQIFQNSSYPSQPLGVLDRVRLDKIVIVPDAALPLAGGLATNNPDLTDKTVDLMWGFPNGSQNSGFYGTGGVPRLDLADSNPFYKEYSVMHELSHARYLIDLYGLNFNPQGTMDDVKVTKLDSSKLLPAGTSKFYECEGGMMSCVTPVGRERLYSEADVFALNAIAGRRAQCGNYNRPCNLGEYMSSLPADNVIKALDAGGSPLSGADVKVYQSVLDPFEDLDFYDKLTDAVPDKQGTTDINGEFSLGNNPFSGVNVWTGTKDIARGVDVVQILKGGQEFYYWLYIPQVNMEYWKGNVVRATYTVQTNISIGDITPPSTPISLNATPAGWTNINSFSMNWTNPGDPSGIAGAYYKLGSAPASPADGTYTTSKPFTASATAEGGQAIYIWLKDGAGNADHNNRSSTLLNYDGTAPSNIAAVSDGTGADIAYTTSASQLSANWTASADAQSGVARYWYAIGATPGAVNVVAWTDNGANMSVTRTSMSLTNGQAYYFTVKAENGAGLQSGAANSNGQTVDTTAPSKITAVSDGTGADIAYTTSAAQLSANWTASADAQSGVVRYWYAIGAAPGVTDVVAWTDNGVNMSVTRTSMSLTNGQAYYFTVKAGNGAGLQSVATDSNGQTVDATAPTSSVSALSQYISAVSANVQWSGNDGSGSGLPSAPYDVQYKAGTGLWTDWLISASLTAITFGPIAPVTVQDGQTYYFRCRARDNAGNLETYPAAQDASVTIDISSPAAPAVSSLTHQEDVWNITSNEPQFGWSAADGVSGVAGYSYELNHDAGFTPDTVMEPAGSSKTYTGVADGIWYFHIRAKDNAGNWGPVAAYGPVKIDLTAPVFTSIIPSKNPAKAGSIILTITAGEQLSDSSATITQLGASPANVPLASSDRIIWTGTGNIAGGFDGTAVINVTGRDLAGKPGSNSAAFQVDTIAPVKSTVASASHPRDTPVSGSNPIFTWNNSTDIGGSGVAGYSYGVNQTENYALDGTTETTGTSVSLTKPDGAWWFHLKAVDNAGNVSDIDRYKFVIDITSPTLSVSATPNPARAGTATLALTSNEILTGTPTVSVRQNGQGSVTAVVMNNAGGLTWQGAYSVTTGFDGPAEINASGIDLASNTGTRTSSFQVDTVGPAASIVLSPPAPLKTGPFTLALTIQDAGLILQAPLLAFTPSGGAAIQIPLTGSDKNWTGSGFINSAASTGTAVFNFTAFDAAGNMGAIISSGGVFGIDTSIDGAVGGTVSNQDNTSVVFPANAYSGPLNVTIQTPSPSLALIVSANDNTRGVIPVKGINLYRDFSALDNATQSPVASFAVPVTIRMPYPDADNNGIVDGTNIREIGLSLFWLDETGSKWEPVSNAVPDYVQNLFSASPGHFSIYAILAAASLDLKTARAYPVPWTPGSGDRFDSPPVNCGQGLQFDKLTSEAEISIYNIRGDLVRRLRVDSADNGCKAWDGKNDSGRPSASGIYLAVIKNPAGEKTVKRLVIER